MNLSNLMKKGTLRQVATVTVATDATDGSSTPSTVASVATVNVAAAQAAASNDAAPQPLATILSDPDRWCWPHSDAMNGAEIDAFTARVHRFTAKGLLPADAEQMADRLVIRDREQDARRGCLECGHCSGSKSWRCGNWAEAGVAASAFGAGLGRDLVIQLQHCSGFREATWVR
jgi:hypothetical protein